LVEKTVSKVLTRSVTARLTVLGIPYCIGGSFASSVYGRARTTFDLDILIAPRLDDLTALMIAFQMWQHSAARTYASEYSYAITAYHA
jgi:hypothetical protein